MNRFERRPALAGYDEDFARWSSEQAALLRAGRLEGVDWENVAEEIESLGCSDKRELAHLTGIILLHLLKWEYQSEKRKPGWLLTLSEQRSQVANLIQESPSLQNVPATILAHSSTRSRAGKLQLRRSCL